MAPILEVKNLSHIYSIGTPFEHTALQEVSFSVEAGEFVGIIGHTGSGKSTLMQHMNGLLKPTSGQILLDGKDIWADKATTRASRFRVGLVFQYPEYQLFEETVYKDIAFGPKNMKLSKEEIDRRVREAAALVGLREEQLEASPFELSGGQKRRVAIAGILAMDPEVIVLDEPAAGLDPSGREEILGRLRAYQRAKNKTVILISHSMEDVARFADELLVLKNGSVFIHDTVDRVFSDEVNLEEAGLALPQITRFMRKLKDSGLAVSGSIHTVDDAVFELKSLLKGGM